MNKELFWKIFDKGGTIAFYVLGVGAGLIALVVWLSQPSEADINAAIEDVTKSEQIYNMAVLNYTERQLNGIDGEAPTPCEIYHKIVYYIDKKLLDPSSLSNGQMMYDFKSFGCSQTEAPKKYRIKKKKEVKEVKTESESQPVPQVQQPAKPKGNTSEAACAAFSRASLELRNGIIDRETFNYLKDEYNWDEDGCANQADDDANYMKAKLQKAREKWRGQEEPTVQPIVRESADYKKQKEEQARLEAMQAENRRLAEENQRLAEERARLEEEKANQARTLEMPKVNEVVDETIPVRKGDCSDPTLLKYTEMYDRGLMGRIEYQDFVYSNGFDKCF